MNRIDEYKYHVVKFLESPFKDAERVSCEDVCVPKSWVKWCSPEDNIVRVWYPTQDPQNTETKVRKREKKSDQWESFLCVLKYSTDIYIEAKMFTLHKKNSENNNKEDRTPLSAMMKKKTSKTTSSVIQNEATVENMLDAIGWSESSKSANSMTLKRRAPADSEKAAHHKRSRVNEPSESVDEFAGPSSQTFELKSNNQTLTHKNSNKDLCIQETPVVNSNDRNSTEKKQIVNKNVSKANHSLGLKSVVQLPIFAKCCKLILELQKFLGNSLVKDIINKLMSTDNSRSALTNDTIASASSVTTVQAPKLNEEKRNKEQIEENESDDDDCDDDDRDEDDHVDYDCDDDDVMNEHTKTKNNPLPIIKQVVPPKYDANDSDDDDRDKDNCDDDDRDDDDDINEHTKTKNNPLPTIKEVVTPIYDANDSDDDDCDDDDSDDDDRDEDDCDDNNEHTKKKNNPLPIIKEVVPPDASDSDDDDCPDDDRDEHDCDDNDDINEHAMTINNPLPIITEVVPPKYDANESEDHDENNYNNILLKTKRPQRIKKVPPKFDASYMLLDW